MLLTLLQITIVLLVIKALDLIGQHYNKEPPRAATRAFRGTIKPKRNIKETLQEELVMPIARKITPWITLEERQAAEWKLRLARADIDCSPQEYVARGITITGMTFLFTVVGLYLGGLVMFMPIGICIVAILGYHQFTLCSDILKQKKEKISKGLPGFVRAILFKLKEARSSPDLIGIFETYLEVADSAFRYDVSLLIMEMKSKSIETALRNFANRIGLTEVNYLCNTLIGVTRGENQELALDRLANDMDLRARENLKRELDKRPGKVTVATLPLVGVAMTAMLYVIIASISSGLGKMI
ncbi:hypothetical protein [Sinanaerobacter sp. ZZT-01]|uniref:hypothetical protein n=1 Tax=Sinanaerobacter sp. ZZT-01 TaxID=3111540 RepID=UPI002D7803A4|nr:hypothetical protein [Sinanaerobacter sp. ZZT-01]WRR93374.1 hypothetical protein U5921_15295 [Sinanaerobacter sp. ZZT-01]